MIKITADLFSGRENPQWLVSDKEMQTLLQDVAHNPIVMAAETPESLGLGYRGLIIESLSEEVTTDYALPSTFRIASPNSYQPKGLEIAERLLKGMLKSTPVAGIAGGEDKGDKAIQKYLLDQLSAPQSSVLSESTVPPPLEGEAAAAAAAACTIELGTFNPAFWNNSAWVGRNNCYNYASNRRTDTYAQPGRAAGSMYSSVNCTQVGAAAVRDGSRQQSSCAPANEAPRWYMALVIAPGPGFVDYHWYRKSREGFWGHKPGGTPARNTDNSGRVIADPRTCNRGPYSIFCGFYYAQKRMRVR